jgi:hypothetical protein
MFIAQAATKTSRAFGGAECCWLSTIKLSSAPPNGDGLTGLTPNYKYSPLRGGHVAITWLTTTPENLPKNKNLLICYAERFLLPH